MGALDMTGGHIGPPLQRQIKMAKNLWSSRFKRELDSTVKCFSYSLYVDGELLEAEIEVDQAHARMLARVGLISSSEGRRLVSALASIGKKFQVRDPHKNPLAAYKNVEDVHTFVQLQLEKKVGSLAKKIHTGRSRNDLVVTCTLVYLRKWLPEISKRIVRFQRSIVEFAQRAGETVIPGLTHLQCAQPVLLAHHVLAYVSMLVRDRSRLEGALSRMNKLPLGAAALAGSSLKLDPRFVARQLGFSGVHENSLDAVSDRDFVIETLSALAILWAHLSRLAEDFILWSSEAFGYIVLDDSVATGSSLMPQKKNPDVFELVRGRAGVIFGHLLSELTLLKGLPLAYNRDLQEDKPALFDSLHKTALALEALRVTIERTRLAEGIEERFPEGDFIYSTDLLEYLVGKGVPFREAHGTVGRLVRHALGGKKMLADLTLEEFRRFSSRFDVDVYPLLDPRVSVSRKRTPGSTQPAQVRKCIQSWKRKFRGA